MTSYFDKIWYKSNFDCQALFVSVPRYLLALKASISGKNEYADTVNKYILEADLVVWDDIGIKSLTDFEHDYLYSYINDRVFNGKSNIFTTNGTLDTLPDILGPRLYSRVCKDCTVIEFKTGDSRKE